MYVGYTVTGMCKMDPQWRNDIDSLTLPHNPAKDHVGSIDTHSRISNQFIRFHLVSSANSLKIILNKRADSMPIQNCPDVLAHGTCSRPGCPHLHNVLTCEICSMVFGSEELLKVHRRTKKHQKRAAASQSGRYLYGSAHCTICNTNVSVAWDSHVRSTKHQKKAKSLTVSPDIDPSEPKPTATLSVCSTCNCTVRAVDWNNHLAGRLHAARIRFTSYQTALQNAEMDRGSVTITGEFDFKFVDPLLAKAGVQKEGCIAISEANARVFLRDVKLASKQGSVVGSSPGFSVTLTPSLATITNLRPLRFQLTFRNSFVGRYEDRLELTFEDARLKQTFVIVRVLRAVVGDQTLHQELQPRAPYIPRTRTKRQVVADADVVPGEKPPAQTVIQYIGRLPKADTPEYLKRVLDNDTLSTGRTLQEVQKMMPASFDSASYGRWFKLLLWVEEHKAERDLERYDIPNATLTRHNRYYYLVVPGLAEKRPSVLIGDRILVQEEGSTTGKWYEGHVHVVRQLEVGLCFHMNFGNHHSPTKRFHVRFKLNRIPTRRQHQAMDTVFTQSRVFFPSQADLDYLVSRRPAEVPLRLFNRLIETNEPQLQAVAGVMAMQPGSLPFIIFGPPGTGKTITMIECIQQVLAANPQARIFACAPSNSAADLIALRLTDKSVFGTSALTKDQLFRFYAPSRHKSQCPDCLLDFTCTTADGVFSVPSNMARIKGFRVIVSTCVSSSFASGIGMPRGHFSHIFVDEAGQATEPEAVMCMKLLGDANTNFVLSGDPKQLGPIIRSTVAMKLGLERSFLERLMESEVYDLQNGRDYCVVKLIKNFRSHAAILKFPNERFYGAELEACADRRVISSFIGSSYLPSPKFPIVFHAVSGKDDREASSPSFFNIDEVVQIKQYVQKLKEDRQFRTSELTPSFESLSRVGSDKLLCVADNDIGIIAPYHAQVVKLRTALRSVADGVKVGSVEEFQGQERRVIIISTVRSSRDFIEYDLRHTLGFVANPRRFNVAVTRAQALLIVVGDPQVLSLDPLWRSFLNYIHNNGGWTGPAITWDPQEEVNEAGGYDALVRDKAGLDMSEFTRRMEEMTMKEVGDDDNAGVDRPWRDVE
ncbi:P-loop containing nucleoside triphosphate hydrolase protein [Panaeolus papilionaceus]|nr:P-loop containing nucleoside triphosphate hydrolase protein [Panaeolus papilionaceus]